jgi:hypothetical protein
MRGALRSPGAHAASSEGCRCGESLRTRAGSRSAEALTPAACRVWLSAHELLVEPLLLFSRFSPRARRIRPRVWVEPAAIGAHSTGTGCRRACCAGRGVSRCRGRRSACAGQRVDARCVGRSANVQLERRLRERRALHGRDGMQLDVDVSAEPAVHQRSPRVLRLRRQDLPGQRHVPGQEVFEEGRLLGAWPKARR